MKISVYGLFCGDRCFYVGSTARPRSRHSSGWSPRVNRICHWVTWRLPVVEEVEERDRVEAENRWIAEMKAAGHRLYNRKKAGKARKFNPRPHGFRVYLTKEERVAVSREARRRGWSMGQTLVRRALKGLMVASADPNQVSAS